jgi:hypothetical protein
VAVPVTLPVRGPIKTVALTVPLTFNAYVDVVVKIPIFPVVFINKCGFVVPVLLPPYLVLNNNIMNNCINKKNDLNL